MLVYVVASVVVSIIVVPMLAVVTWDIVRCNVVPEGSVVPSVLVRTLVTLDVVLSKILSKDTVVPSVLVRTVVIPMGAVVISDVVAAVVVPSDMVVSAV